MSTSEPLVQSVLLGEAVEHAPVAILVADDEMRYVAANATACELLGYTREELLQLRVTGPGAVPRGRGRVRGDDRRRRADRAYHRRAQGRHRPQTSATAPRETKIAGLAYYVAVLWPEQLAVVVDVTAAPARSRERSKAAPTKSRKSGAGRVGRDLNSGWNWLATNHGWSGSSTISTSRPSWNVPETTRPGVDELLAVLVVDLVAVAVALVDDELAVGLARLRALGELDRLRAEPHRAAEVLDLLLLGQQVDHRDTASRDPSRSSWRRRARRRGARTRRRRRACRGRCRGTGSRARGRRGRRGSCPPSRASRSRPGRARRRPVSSSACASSSDIPSASTQRTRTVQPWWTPACLSASCTER